MNIPTTSIPQRHHVGRYPAPVQHQQSLWYRRPKDRRLVLSSIFGLVFLIFAFATAGVFREHLENSKNRYGFLKNLGLGSRVFGIVCFVMFSTPRLLGQAGFALRDLAYGYSRLGTIVRNRRVIRFTNATFLALLLVGLTSVVMNWVGFSCKPCDPETEKGLGWCLTQGTHGDLMEGLRRWGTILWGSLSIAYNLHMVGIWCPPDGNLLSWASVAFLFIAVSSTVAE